MPLAPLQWSAYRVGELRSGRRRRDANDLQEPRGRRRPPRTTEVAAYGVLIAGRDRIEELRAELAYLRQKRDLYRAKSYGLRGTSPERMRELERMVDSAEERLANAKRDAP